jgi:2-oxoglutarate ferredoxin oxidoreductase subunit delta
LNEPATKARSNTEQETEEKVHVFEAWCKRCSICVAFCPTDALTSDKEGFPVLTYPEKCTQCGMCEIRCPDFAIAVRPRERKDTKKEDSEKTK